MKKFNKKILNVGYLGYRWISPFADILKVKTSLFNLPTYLKNLLIYSKKASAEKINFIDTYPIFYDRTNKTKFDSHYVYQDLWAMKNIYKSKPKTHYDIGSNVEFTTALSVFTKVKFVDLRPLDFVAKNFEMLSGDILNLPFSNNSIKSLSCLHVAEHIGLGRYGDKLDPLGTKKACLELARVLAKNGKLYFSLPVGKKRLCFDAHRIHTPKEILKYFRSLKLIEFSGISDEGEFKKNVDPDELKHSNYACGLFVFTKK